MSPREVASHYPGAELAVELCEYHPGWSSYRAIGEKTDVEFLKERMRKYLQEASKKERQPELKLIQEAALDEWDHPNFIKYLKAKIGDV